MADTPEPFQLAPNKLLQTINPWFNNSTGDQFGLFNISLGDGDQALERKILKKVGSYGKQIGHLGEALEVVIKLLQQIAPKQYAALSDEDRDKLTVALGDVASVRQHKPAKPIAGI